MKKLLTTRELARLWGVSPQRIRQFVAEGRITPAVHVPATLLLFSPDTRRPESRQGQRPTKPARRRRK